MKTLPLNTGTKGGSWAFASFVLDLDRRELRYEGVKLRLTARPFDTLVFLIENRGHVVTRDELRSAVWEGLNVSDPAVEHAVNKVRKALMDDPANPSFIQTLWGKGYIFVAEVSEALVSPATLSETQMADKTASGLRPEHFDQPPSIAHMGMNQEVKISEHAIQMAFACLVYAVLYAVSLLVETAYAFERYRYSLPWVASAIFLWIFLTTFGAAWVDWMLSRRGGFHGVTLAILIMLSSSGALFLSLEPFLPGSAITLFSFQGFTADAAYFKSESYFLTLGIGFLVLPFHFVGRVQREVQARRPEIARSLLSGGNMLPSAPLVIYPRPTVMLALLLVAVLGSLFSVAHIFEHLLPSPYMSRYMNLVQVERLVYFALGFECLAWYQMTLGRLQRGLLVEPDFYVDNPLIGPSTVTMRQ